MRIQLTQDIADAVFYTVFEMNQENIVFTEFERYNTIYSLLFDKDYFPHQFFKEGWKELLRNLLYSMDIKPCLVEINPDFSVYSYSEIAKSYAQYQQEFMARTGTISHIGTSTGGLFEIFNGDSYELKYSPGEHTVYGPVTTPIPKPFVGEIYDAGTGDISDDYDKAMMLYSFKEPGKSPKKRRRGPSIT